jgi:predicted transcriptional regulator of viral defense system
MTPRTDRQRLLDLARRKGIFRAADVTAAGIHTEWLSRLVGEGALERVARGCYRRVGGNTTEHHTLAVVAAVAPTAVVCLLSALQLHEIGTQAPPEVWIALERGKARPRLGYPPLRVLYVSGAPYRAGITTRVIEGQRVRVYSVAKTVADCFKYRNKIGLDVALEALADAWQQRRFTLPELNELAAINGVQRVMHPYVEAVIR